MMLHNTLRGLAFCIALSIVQGCNKNKVDTQQLKITELNAQYSHVSKQLSAAYELLSEIEDSQGSMIRYQVIVEPAKFKATSKTAQQVKDRKELICGGNADLPGFGYLTPDSGEYEGFDIDICRAIGAAVLGAEGADQIEIKPVTSKLRFAALQTGSIDVLSRNTTWTLSRDAELKADFAAVTFYDGQGMLVRSKDEIRKLSDLEAKSICVQAGGTSSSNIKEYYAALDIKVEVREFVDRTAALAQYEERGCDAYTGDKSSLVAQRILLKDPDAHRILVDDISREPLGPVVRHDDDNWKDIVSWTVQCLINGEALGVSQANVEQHRNSENLKIRRLLGDEGELGAKMGLANDFCYQVISQIGNYSDIYDRHLGSHTQLNLVRGINALYTDGGIQYPLPFN